jgi:hypothetical protein
LWQYAGWTNFQTNFNLVSTPVLNNVTISPSTINPDNSSTYVIAVTTSDPLGAANVSNNYAIINYAGTNAGNYRGYLTWHWANAWPSAQENQACSGAGGYAAVQSGYGNTSIHLASCNVTDAGNSRTTNFTVRFEPAFSSPTTNNDISGLGCNIVNGVQTCIGWNNFDLNFALTTFNLSVTTAGTGSGTVGGGGNYYAGALATATQSASAGSTFAGWSGACNGSGQVTMNSAKTCTATFTMNPPATPTGLSVTPSSCGNNWLNISWNAATYATNYKVYRGGSLVYDGAGLSFSDTGLTLSTAYSYTVTASNVGGTSAASGAVSNTVAPYCPINGSCGPANKTYPVGSTSY